MNEELQNFIIKITTEGFADVKNTLNQTNKELDDMQKSFDKTTKSGDSFFGALVKWTGLVGGLTLAFQTLKNTIRGVFDTAYDVVDLYRQEQLLGVEARVLEKYGIVAQRNRGSQADAYSFFGDVNELMGRFRSGKINQDDMYKFSKLGIGFNYNAGESLSQNRDRYLQALHSAVSNMNLNNADQVSIMKDLIKPASMQALFMANDEQFQKQMAWGDKWRVLSRDTGDLQDAQNLITVQTEWKQTLTDFKVQLMPVLSDILNALRPLIPVIKEKITLMGDWVDENADKIAEYVEKGVNWLINDFPQFLSDMYNLLKAIVGALSPIVEWVIEKLGGSFKAMYDTFRLGWKGLRGDEDAGELAEQLGTKYLTEGSTAGGYFGDFLRWGYRMAGGTPLKPSSITNNNGNTYNIKAGTTFTKDVSLTPNGIVSSGGAHFATANK